MYSFCLKTNNSKIADYLVDEMNQLSIDSLKFSKKKFKIYSNIIFHYDGDKYIQFYEIISMVITNTIIHFYERDLLKKKLLSNYFYFSKGEQKEILEIADSLINSDEQENKAELIYISVYNYLIENKSMILDGFVSFRLKDYIEIIEYVVDLAVNSFLIKREYLEFINLLKSYVKTKPSEVQIVHLIYLNSESILLDKKMNIINTDTDIFTAKYLSDITFSSNDYALNTILNLLPQKLYIHLLDKNEDEFINTLKSIFENRVSICYDCEICNLYRAGNKVRN